ncbi:MAG: glycoside hydrolase N-terminal domain-containing protein [bacterium]
MTDFKSLLAQLALEYPDRGFVCAAPAERWQDGTITGNGSQGALCFGEPYEEEIVLSHESLFLQIYAAGKFIRLGAHLYHIRNLVLQNEGD